MHKLNHSYFFLEPKKQKSFSSSLVDPLPNSMQIPKRYLPKHSQIIRQADSIIDSSSSRFLPSCKFRTITNPHEGIFRLMNDNSINYPKFNPSLIVRYTSSLSPRIILSPDISSSLYRQAAAVCVSMRLPENWKIHS